MKDYSAMNDYLINQHVAESLTGRYLYFPDYVWDSEEEKRFDPCNNPADAWPILMANHIGIMPFKSGAATAWPTSIGLLSNFHVKHENPLRAAMIVYLMKKDAEKCDG